MYYPPQKSFFSPHFRGVVVQGTPFLCTTYQRATPSHLHQSHPSAFPPMPSHSTPSRNTFPQHLPATPSKNSAYYTKPHFHVLPTPEILLFTSFSGGVVHEKPFLCTTHQRATPSHLHQYHPRTQTATDNKKRYILPIHHQKQPGPKHKQAQSGRSSPPG